jgi:hypothetical protein
MADDTYAKPAHGWTCFFCGETFKTEGSARVHFGADPGAKPGCQIRVAYGAERGLLMALRKAEDELAEIRSEHLGPMGDAYKMVASLQGRHSDALRSAEELGYERGLEDGRKLYASRLDAAWKALGDAGFYGHDSSTLEDGIRWLAQKASWWDDGGKS